MRKNKLHKELKAAGANNQEIWQLADLAESLSTLRPRGLSNKAKEHFLESISLGNDESSDVGWFTQVRLAGAVVTACLIIVAGLSFLPKWLSDNTLDNTTQTFIENGVKDEAPSTAAPAEELQLEQKEEVEPTAQEDIKSEDLEKRTPSDTESDRRQRRKRYNPYSNFYRWRSYNYDHWNQPEEPENNDSRRRDRDGR